MNGVSEVMIVVVNGVSGVMNGVSEWIECTFPKRSHTARRLWPIITL